MADKVMGTSSSLELSADAIPASAALVDCAWTVSDAGLATVTPHADDFRKAILQSAGAVGTVSVLAVAHDIEGTSFQDEKTIQITVPAEGLEITFP